MLAASAFGRLAMQRISEEVIASLERIALEPLGFEARTPDEMR